MQVGVAQQWYDEIDNLSFTTSEIDSSMEVQTKTSDCKVKDGSVCIKCIVSTSPGTSEVCIFTFSCLRFSSEPM